jgi:hypothetical protein
MRDTKSSGKILVVDDEPHLLDLLVDVLSEDGYEVDGVATGKPPPFMPRNTTYPGGSPGLRAGRHDRIGPGQGTAPDQLRSMSF